jgi:8-oxo-dGTP pyrophosphatase MutT (NUDIX family)
MPKNFEHQSKIEKIRRHLANHHPAALPGQPKTRAAVAMILQPYPADALQMLFIHRAHHPQDPWSGHMAFPGGRQEPDDPDLSVTIHRETFEEVGIDLARHGRYLGRLSEAQASARGRVLSMTVSPFVYEVGPEVQPSPDPVEVQGTVWIPLPYLQQEDSEKLVRIALPGGSEVEMPAVVYQGHMIWGLTYRMLRGFLDLCF